MFQGSSSFLKRAASRYGTPIALGATAAAGLAVVSSTTNTTSEDRQRRQLNVSSSNGNAGVAMCEKKDESVMGMLSEIQAKVRFFISYYYYYYYYWCTFIFVWYGYSVVCCYCHPALDDVLEAYFLLTLQLQSGKRPNEEDVLTLG